MPVASSSAALKSSEPADMPSNFIKNKSSPLRKPSSPKRVKNLKQNDVKDGQSQHGHGCSHSME